MSDSSPFLDIPETEWLAATRFAFAVPDRFPVSPGHCLVVPRRLVPTWWEATAEERSDILSLVDEVKRQLDRTRNPEGYNVGFNAGTVAGQTVHHLHVHVIPRYSGDVADPRGGIRHVIPGKGNYLAGMSAPPRLVDGMERILRDELLQCLRDARFDRVSLLVSFVMQSGVRHLADPLLDALDRGAQVRVLTTDYLAVTDPEALSWLLDVAGSPGRRIESRVFMDPVTSFHPKAYLFSASDGSAAMSFVGSSNLSGSGIAGGIEWNVGTEQAAPMLASFERLWSDGRSRPLTSALLRDYRSRWRRAPSVETGVVPEPPAVPPAPRPIQREALDELARTRQQGFKAGLVVLATGLGKTWLAAFDSSRPEFRRVLFVAHREEILRQALAVFRQIQPDGDLGLFFGGEKKPAAHSVFASVQTLAGNLGSFDPEQFDYVVVDEFHHAAARSYRKVLDRFRPKFLLGLTATPYRLDGADLLALCADNLAYECGLVEGIDRDELAAFQYYGIRDDVDYEPIPWRNGRFDPDALTQAVETHDRAQHALDIWRERARTRTLAFCVTVTHADFMARYFQERGVAAVAVHSGSTSAPRRGSIEDLRGGRLQVIFTVDVFNEGLDLPAIDTVLMLRPTESPVVFLQQLGRGLRRTEEKTSLTVVDFIGNHRSFLLKPRTLLALGRDGRPSSEAVLRAMASGDFGLPAGCAVQYDPELVDMMRSVARLGARSAVADYCQAYAAERGYRPTALQAFEAGYNPAAVRAQHGSWFGLLGDLGLLTPEEAGTHRRHGDVLDGFEREPITKAYKLVTLLALLRLDALRTGAGVTELAWAARQIIIADPRLLEDVRSKELPDPAEVSVQDWRRYWVAWPLSHWTGRGRGAQGWFTLDGSRFVPRFRVEDVIGETFDAMVAEIADYRLARYLFGKRTELRAAIRLRVIQTQGRPIIMLDRGRYPGLPIGKTVFLADGVTYVGDFVKIALNVARQEGEGDNMLPDLLRRWFGRAAGEPGTHHEVELLSGEPGWTMSPAEVGGPDTSLRGSVEGR